MNISEVSTKLSGSDIKSIINDFVKVEGLTISSVDIVDNSLRVKGAFKKILSLGFSATVDITGVEDNYLTIRLKKVSLMKIGILKAFRKIALKFALKGFKERGITLASDKITINISKILEEVKVISFNLTNANISDGTINVTVNDIDILLGDMISKKPSVVVEEKVQIDEEVLTEEEKEDYILNLNVEKIEDSYTHGREKVVEKIPMKAKEYSDIIMFLPDVIALVARLFKDKRVPTKTKVVLAVSLGYTAIPLDILPDKIPILGKIDDVAIILFALNRMIEDIPIEVILENWQGNRELVIVLTSAVEYLSNFTAAKNLNRIYDVIGALGY
ncbi:MAG: YkvA family protein [Sarcina sp.]